MTGQDSVAALPSWTIICHWDEGRSAFGWTKTFSAPNGRPGGESMRLMFGDSSSVHFLLVVL
jgi:hypothetical protein